MGEWCACLWVCACVIGCVAGGDRRAALALVHRGGKEGGREVGRQGGREGQLTERDEPAEVMWTGLQGRERRGMCVLQGWESGGRRRVRSTFHSPFR
jgi:hypothetical protein